MRTRWCKTKKRIYEAPAPGSDPTTPMRVSGCALGQPVLPLDEPGDLVFAFRGTALALAGHVAGYAAESCDVATGDCFSDVFAVDLAQPDFTKQRLVGHRAARFGQGVVKVGSLRVTRTGSLAWITCPERTPHGLLSAARKPNCVHPGDRDTVISLTIGASAVQILDAGKRIDPSSLQLRGSRLTWIDRARKRHAVFP
jgi:hypothetical protein